MSGRRRRDDEWGDGRLDAQDGRRDPWADDSVGEWGGHDADYAAAPDRSRASSGGAAGAYVRNASQSGNAYAAPDFPSFQGGGASSGDRYGTGSGTGSQRGSANGYASAGYGGDGYRDAGYGASRDGYQSGGYQNGGYQSGGYGRSSSSGNGAGYGRPAGGAGGRGNDAGYGASAGYGAANGRAGGAGYAPEFAPADHDEADDDGQAGTPRPYGRLSIYTLHEDKTREFDRLAERAAEGVRAAEPDTLVYVIHVVPKAPQQRIIYEIYRDRAAFMSHERQPHIRQFTADRAPCVLATNIIDLRLKYAKVAALGSPTEATAQAQPQSQSSRSPRSADATQGSDRYGAATQYSASPQYSSGQYSSGQYASSAPQGSSAAGASFTPAAASDRYGTDNSQYPTVGREAYSPAPQYGNSANGAYGAGSSQYGAANSNGYAGAAGYANGGSYSSNGYPSANGYQAANGYSGDNGYSSANGYQSANGYSGANGYSTGSSYQNANGYQGSSDYASGANGYGSGYANGAANGGNGYGAAAGYTESGAGSYGAAPTAQYTPRYRELTSGSSSDAAAGGYQDSGSRYQDDGRQSGSPQQPEWDPRSQDYR